MPDARVLCEQGNTACEGDVVSHCHEAWAKPDGDSPDPRTEVFKLYLQLGLFEVRRPHWLNDAGDLGNGRIQRLGTISVLFKRVAKLMKAAVDRYIDFVEYVVSPQEQPKTPGSPTLPLFPEEQKSEGKKRVLPRQSVALDGEITVGFGGIPETIQVGNINEHANTISNFYPLLNHSGSKCGQVVEQMPVLLKDWPENVWHRKDDPGIWDVG